MTDPDRDEMVEALEWYAEQVAGCRKISDIGRPYQIALDADGGKRARDALATYRAKAAAPVAGEGLTDEEIGRWLEANCGRGLPYKDATNLATALHGIAYTLRQIEASQNYRPHIGQLGPAATALRWALFYIARHEMPTPTPTPSRQDELEGENARLREALESIGTLNVEREWTATEDNPEATWVSRPGYYARIARAALQSQGQGEGE